MHGLITFMARVVGMGLIATTAMAQAQPEISADDARRDLRILKRALVDLHPGLYRYATPAQLDAEFAAAEHAVAQGSDRAQLYLLASRIAASVHCGHTWASRYNQADVVVKTVFERQDKLPLTLRWAEGRALVTGSMTANVATGSELLAIDGRSMADISHALLPYIRADATGASSVGTRLSQLDSHANGGVMDRIFPLLFAPSGSGYKLRLRDGAQATPREVTVAAVKLADRERQLPAESTSWQFRVDGDTAVLTLPTFAFWRSDFKPHEFLDRTFETLRNTPQVRFLIIDQRRNEGGDDSIGRKLLSHLQKAPFTQPGYRMESAYERVPYALARYLDTWDFSFFDRTGQVTRGAGRNWWMGDVAGRRIEPATTPLKPFTGRTVLLVGPQNSSAGFLLARDVKNSGAATLVGQMTGGNQRGLNGGQLAWINLPASGVGVDIPLVASIIQGDVPDGGVGPDVLVTPRFDDVQAGVDAEMAQAQKLIASWRAAVR